MNLNSICHPPICNLPSYYFTQSPHPSSVSLVTLTNPTPQLTKLKPTKLYLTKLRFILNSFPLFDRCLNHTHTHTHISTGPGYNDPDFVVSIHTSPPQLHSLSDFFFKLMFSTRSAKKVKKQETLYKSPLTIVCQS